MEHLEQCTVGVLFQDVFVPHFLRSFVRIIDLIYIEIVNRMNRRSNQLF